MLVLTMVVVSLSIFYWGWLGLPLTPFQHRRVWLRGIDCLECRKIDRIEWL
jgi:hypothetical protein